MATTRGSGANDSAPAGTSEAAAAAVDVGQLSYSNAGAELDAIIEEFETGVIDVDRLVEQLERATEIVDELDRRLRRTRMRVEELVPRLEAIGQTDLPGDGPGHGDDGEDGDDDDVVEYIEVIEETVTVEGEGAPPGLF
jgi:exodeoxyribonuclease VII small subunit